MRSRLATSAVLVCCGCVSNARVADEMKQALVRTNEALALVLVAIEPTSYVIDPLWSLPDTTTTTAGTLRHPASGPCPSNEHDTEDPVAFHTDLDYGDGCLPRSRLLPTVVSGAHGVDVTGGDFELTWDGLDLALTNAVTGLGAGSVSSPDGVDEHVALVGDLAIAGDEALSARVELDAVIGVDTISFDGTVEGDWILTFTGVVLPYDAVIGECPTPSAGTATTDLEGVPLVVELGGDSEVTVTRKGRISDPTDLCGFDSWIFSP